MAVGSCATWPILRPWRANETRVGRKKQQSERATAVAGHERAASLAPKRPSTYIPWLLHLPKLSPRRYAKSVFCARRQALRPLELGQCSWSNALPCEPRLIPVHAQRVHYSQLPNDKTTQPRPSSDDQRGDRNAGEGLCSFW